MVKKQRKCVLVVGTRCLSALAKETMPLGKNVKKNFEELFADNKKKGKARGANGKPRSRAQIIAIALGAAGKGKKKS